MENAKEMTSTAAWIFGTASFVFILAVYILSPEELPSHKIRILALVSAILMGFFGFFFSGALNIGVTGQWPGIGQVVLQSSGGIALFLITLYWWNSGLAPVKKAMPADVYEAFENQTLLRLPIYQMTELVTNTLRGRTDEILMGQRALGYVDLAKQSFEQKRYQDCLECCNKALQIESDLPWANFIRAHAYISLGDYQKAIADTSLIITILPDFGWPYRDRILAYTVTGKLAEAYADAEKLCNLGDCSQKRLLDEKFSRKNEG